MSGRVLGVVLVVLTMATACGADQRVAATGSSGATGSMATPGSVGSTADAEFRSAANRICAAATAEGTRRLGPISLDSATPAQLAAGADLWRDMADEIAAIKEGSSRPDLVESFLARADANVVALRAGKVDEYSESFDPRIREYGLTDCVAPPTVPVPSSITPGGTQVG